MSSAEAALKQASCAAGRDTTRPAGVSADDHEVDEHTTNIVTSMFTTGFNLGGIVGPLLGATLIPFLGGFADDFPFGDAETAGLDGEQVRVISACGYFLSAAPELAFA